MTDWKDKIEAQIEDLREEAINYGGGRAYGQHLDDTADTMQALLDVAVAAEKEHDAGRYISKFSSRESWKKWVKACDEHHDALNKLREVSDE